MTTPHLLKSQLSHTWPAFFAGHGAFTEVQRRAIPVILSGRDALVVAATASGKTEAAMAPLLERHLVHERQAGLAVLYICPTKALVRDLYERLAPPLRGLGVTVAMKSGDTAPVSRRRPPTVLITTPESTDSLLTRAPRLFATLSAVVLDEIHLFDGGPRGDHLRCLLRRVETIRGYAEPGRAPAQRVALSATVAEPEAVAGRYLNSPVLVQVAGGRKLEAELVAIYDLDDLVTALARRATRKMLVFCNTRHEVEEVAAYLRGRLPYEAAVFVHYSNLDPALRREVEAQFAEASVAVCVSSSTLELGIDIGSIDEVALVGPPPTLGSFLQRIGRGGRRGQATRVLCLTRSPAETLRFEALLSMARASHANPDRSDHDGSDHDGSELGKEAAPRPGYHFRLAVLVQQSFSLLKGSPTGGLRFADLRRVAPDEVDDERLWGLLRHLAATGYLKVGRPGEWRAGPKLNELADEHEIYSNIGGEALGTTIIDAYSGRAIARADRPRHKGERLLMGGRSVEVAWQDRYRVGVEGRRGSTDEMMRFHTAPVAIPVEVAQGVAARLGLGPGRLPSLPDERGMWLFHFWGDLYGDLLAAVLRAHFTPEGADEPSVAAWNEYCLYLPFPLSTLPPWDEGLAREEAQGLAGYVARLLELGRFHVLLPPELAAHGVLEGLDLPRLEALYRAASLVSAPAGLRARLQTLL
jgi:ATP-dependent Lhr-like helicase